MKTVFYFPTKNCEKTICWNKATSLGVASSIFFLVSPPLKPALIISDPLVTMNYRYVLRIYSLFHLHVFAHMVLSSWLCHSGVTIPFSEELNALYLLMITCLVISLIEPIYNVFWMENFILCIVLMNGEWEEKKKTQYIPALITVSLASRKAISSSTP